MPIWEEPGWTEEFVKVVAERKFKEYAKGIGSQITPELLQYLAETNTPLSEILSITGRRVTAVHGVEGNPMGRYLLSLPNRQLIELLKDALPVHAKTLELYPEFADGVARDLKGMVVGR